VDGDLSGDLSMGAGCWTPLLLLSPHCSPTLSCGTPLLGGGSNDYDDDYQDNNYQDNNFNNNYQGNNKNYQDMNNNNCFDILQEAEGCFNEEEEEDDSMGLTVPVYWMSPDCSDSCETAAEPLRSVAMLSRTYSKM
jgi:hypothetical protein